jgi:SAM-dependent methyltransferase
MSDGDAAAENIRERVEPRLSDRDYLALSDLRMFLERFRTAESLSILDYGAGTSPYRSLFPNAKYQRADYVEQRDLDYLVPYDSTLPTPDQSFDFVLSTQVAEHVAAPSNYFAEAFRVLKTGGKFVVTTHGTWEDHGVPYDFQRWTGDGLQRDLEAVGFSDVRIAKLTTSHRFYVFLVLGWLGKIYSRRGALFYRVTGWIVRRVVKTIRPGVHWLVDRLWPACRIVEADELPRNQFYCVIAGQATRQSVSQ